MKKRSVYLNIIVIVVILLLFNKYVYAIAGGGHADIGSTGGDYDFHSSDGGGYSWPEILIGVFILSIFEVPCIILFLKAKKAKLTLQSAREKDLLWDESKIEEHTKQIFHNMQHAWMMRDIQSVQHLITNEMYEDYKQRINVMIQNNEKNILESIEITEVKIIGCEDFINNDNDRYVAYVTGTMIDYTIKDEPSPKITYNPDKLLGEFKCTYHFIRNNNQWLLSEINNDPSFSQLFTIKNHIERLT